MRATNAASFVTLRLRTLILGGVFLIMAAVVAAPFYSVRSSSLAEKASANTRPATAGLEPSKASKAGAVGFLLSVPTSLAETISTFAADCTTPRTTFYLGETVCAKTDGVDLQWPGGRWVDWILTGSPNTIVSGSRTTTLITANPQTFTYTATATGTYKVEITQDLNGQDDPQTPAVFTVVDRPPVVTYGYDTNTNDCTFPRTDFVLGDTVCVKQEGLAVNAMFPNRFAWADTAGLIRQKTNLTTDPQTDTFQLPSSASSLLFGGITVDNRGTWRVSSTRNNGRRIIAAEFVVSDPQQSVADVFAQNFVRGDAIFAPGGLVAVTIVVGNNGPNAAVNVNLATGMPVGATLVNFTQQTGPNCLPANTGNCTIAALANGSRAEFTAIYDTGAAGGGEYSTSAAVAISNPQVDSNTNNNSSAATYQISASGGTPACTIICPTSPAAVTAAPGQNGAVVDWDGANNDNIATASGTCGSVSYSAPSGSFFSIGTTPVTVTTESGETCTFAVTVLDSEAPVIGNCPANITVTEDSGTPGSAIVTYASPSATDNSGSATVICSPASGSTFAVTGSPHTVTCTASDDGGNTDSCSFTVTINAANTECSLTPPANITVDSDANQCGANVTYTAPTSSGNCGTVTCDRASGSFFPGGTTVVTCSDGAGASASFTVTVNDKTAPVPALAELPTLTGDCSVTAGVPVVIDPPGPTPPHTVIDLPKATDNCGASISASTTDERTYTQAGTYVVNWTYTDGNGNVSTQQQTVIVTGNDNSAPVPDVVTLPTVTDECQVSSITPPTATDNCAGTVTGTTTDLPVVGAGTHIVVWTYDDGRGNTSQQSQTVIVTDTQAPTVTLTGPSTVTVECHTGYTDAGATATDNCSPAPAPTSTGSVDVNTPGTYQVVWTATDAGGNTDSETRTVVVVDTTAPMITLNGASTMTVECHTTFNDPGASAADSCDTSVPVNVAGSVNADAVGTYTLTYTASDDSGNAATSLTRTVNVVDTTAPAVTLSGAATMTVILGSGFSDPGATANDSCTGTLPVAVAGTVNTSAIGTYTLTYSATDASNNTGSATRTVNVIYNFTGFFSPVNNLPTLNHVNAGRTIPLKFSLSGNHGLGIFAAGYPASKQVACDSSAPLADLEATETSGGSTLTYSPDQYQYSWKTESSWAGTCRQLVITLNDGTVHTANFKFK